jgi:pyruvate-ferredoxin/flavodoxin oxidoreductase
MTTAMTDQKVAVESGQWLLYRFHPERAAIGENPLALDSRAPTRKVQDYLLQQTRFKMLTKSKPEDAERLWKQAQKDVESRFRMYEYMASRKTQPEPETPPAKSEPAKAERPAPVEWELSKRGRTVERRRNSNGSQHHLSRTEALIPAGSLRFSSLARC